MKQLSSLLKEKTAILNDTLDLHFYAEFVLNESFKRSYFQITEKYGSYIGQKELIIALAKEIWPTIENKSAYWRIINLLKNIQFLCKKSKLVSYPPKFIFQQTFYCNCYMHSLNLILNTGNFSF